MHLCKGVESGRLYSLGSDICSIFEIIIKKNIFLGKTQYMQKENLPLTLPAPIPEEEKITYFYFYTSLWCLKRFYGSLKGVSIEVGWKYCFSLVTFHWDFCGSNALCSARLSFNMFIFLLTSFNTWDCHYFKSNLSLVLLVKVLLMSM